MAVLAVIEIVEYVDDCNYSDDDNDSSDDDDDDSDYWEDGGDEERVVEIVEIPIVCPVPAYEVGIGDPPPPFLSSKEKAELALDLAAPGGPGRSSLSDLFDRHDFRRIAKHYKKTAGPEHYYKVVQRRNKEGTTHHHHVVATKTIPEGKVLLVEKAMYSQQPTGFSSDFDQKPNLKRLLNSPHLEEIWKLDDTYREARVGDEVRIDGVSKSAGGAELNGQHGTVISQQSDNPQHQFMLGVSLANHRGIIEFLPRANLKTLQGICRTNLMESDTTKNEVLFKTVSRINHGSKEDSNVLRVINHQTAFIIAKQTIRPGDEIFMDYLFGEYDDDTLKDSDEEQEDLMDISQRSQRLQERFGPRQNKMQQLETIHSNHNVVVSFQPDNLLTAITPGTEINVDDVDGLLTTKEEDKELEALKKKMKKKLMSKPIPAIKAAKPPKTSSTTAATNNTKKKKKATFAEEQPNTTTRGRQVTRKYKDAVNKEKKKRGKSPTTFYQKLRDYMK